MFKLLQNNSDELQQLFKEKYLFSKILPPYSVSEVKLFEKYNKFKLPSDVFDYLTTKTRTIRRDNSSECHFNIYNDEYIYDIHDDYYDMDKSNMNWDTRLKLEDIYRFKNFMENMPHSTINKSITIFDDIKIKYMELAHYGCGETDLLIYNTKTKKWGIWFNFLISHNSNWVQIRSSIPFNEYLKIPVDINEKERYFWVKHLRDNRWL